MYGHEHCFCIDTAVMGKPHEQCCGCPTRRLKRGITYGALPPTTILTPMPGVTWPGPGTPPYPSTSWGSGEAHQMLPTPQMWNRAAA